MNWSWGEDETKFKKYIKEIHNNDTWLIHKKQLEDEGRWRRDFTHDPIEEGQLYLLSSGPSYFYYYLPTSLRWGSEKVGFQIYLPTEEFKKKYAGLTDYEIFYENPTSLPSYVHLLTKILIPHQLINWNNLPWGDIK